MHQSVSFLYRVVMATGNAGRPLARLLQDRLRRSIKYFLRFATVALLPFDGFEVPEGKSVIAEVYPALYKRSFPIENRTPDEHDAWFIAAGCRRPTGAASLLTISRLRHH